VCSKGWCGWGEIKKRRVFLLVSAASTSRLNISEPDNPCLISREKRAASCLERRREIFMRTSLARTLCNLHVASAVHNLLASYRLAHRSGNKSRTWRARNICDGPAKLKNKEREVEKRKLDLRTGTTSEGLEEGYSQAQFGLVAF